MEKDSESPERNKNSSPGKTNNYSSPLKKHDTSESSFNRPSSAQLNDYSPSKGLKSISSFFTPPKAASTTSANSLAPSSLQRISKSSPSHPVVFKPVKTVRIISDTSASEGDDDLTMSEGEEGTKPSVTTIPFNYNESGNESEKQESESEAELEGNVVQEHEHHNSSSSSDISVVISLPSSDELNSDNNYRNGKSMNVSNFNNSEYEETDFEDDVSNIPVSLDSDEGEEEEDQIPLMVFNSSDAKVIDSPVKKPQSPVREAEVVSSTEQPARIVKPSSPELQVLSSSSFKAPSMGIAGESAPIQVPPLIRVGRPPSPKRQALSSGSSNFGVEGKPTASTHGIGAHGASLSVGKFKTGFVYDERMLHHSDPHDPEHPERPARITCIYEKLRAARLLDRSYRIPVVIKLVDFNPEVQAIHDPKYCKKINQTSLMKNLDDLGQFSSQFNSVYVSPSTAISATVAAAATIELCVSIARGEVENGFAIVRPPGHHAEHDEAMGFCIYNNVAVAASTLLRKKLASRILILDWDVHHGNGTQNAFAESGDVLYVSIHRYDGGKFYPHIEEASSVYVGSGGGLGKSVNVAWNGPGFGDADYLFAFSRLIMPIAREFNPDFVIVSAGFDAASGDPIGECEVTPFGYSMMLTELMSLAGGKLALVLEGGYNLEVISRCYESCVRVLLKEAAPVSPGPMIASPRAIFAVESAVISQSPYWKCLFPKPAQLCLSENTPQVSLPVILDHFWRAECSEKFHLKPMRGLFKSCSESFAAKYTNRVLGSESVHFGPDVLIVFAHESGPVHSGSFISSLCLQAGKISQSLPFASLLQSVHQTNYAMIDVSLPSRTWKLKQPSLGNEVEAQEFNVLFALIWDRLITPSRCKNVFFVAAGSPIFSLANLINTKNDIDQHLRGCFFFSSSLFIPTINQSPQKADWYKRNSYVAVPSQEPIKRPIANAAASFGSCYSAGQWIMSDSAAAVGDFKYEVINFIRTRILLNQ